MSSPAEICLYCRHTRKYHKPDAAGSSYKFGDKASGGAAHPRAGTINNMPAHCTQPACACVMFCETEIQVLYCKLPTKERWKAVRIEAKALGLTLANPTGQAAKNLGL